MTGIYIHIPFCGKKCPYCDFYSCKYSRERAEKYKNAVIRNIKTLKNVTADTVYFGGGTPSILPFEYIGDMMEALNKNLMLDSPEITIEVNPCTVNVNKLREYKKIGINRLSIGVQSGNNNELEFLGRSHSFEKAEEVIYNAYDVGFENISCDVMLGVKDQTIQGLEESLKKIIKMPVNHISSYILKVENNTPFGKNNINSLLPDDDSVADLYLHSVKVLNDSGFRQYEISNFAKSEFQSRHNLKYWKCKEYIGIGPSAHSYYNGKRYYVPKELETFCDMEYQEIIYEEYIPGTDEEKIMLGLRLNEGIHLDEFMEIRKKIVQKAEKYCSNGFAIMKNNRLCLTPKGFLVSNSIIADLIDSY